VIITWPINARRAAASTVLAKTAAINAVANHVEHIRRRTPSEKIFMRWRQDVHDLGVFGEKTFVLDVAGNNCNIAPDHRTPLVADAEIHFSRRPSQNFLHTLAAYRGRLR
jgi:hypothetical protein